MTLRGALWGLKATVTERLMRDGVYLDCFVTVLEICLCAVEQRLEYSSRCAD